MEYLGFVEYLDFVKYLEFPEFLVILQFLESPIYMEFLEFLVSLVSLEAARFLLFRFLFRLSENNYIQIAYGCRIFCVNVNNLNLIWIQHNHLISNNTKLMLNINMTTLKVNNFNSTKKGCGTNSFVKFLRKKLER